MKYLGPTWVMTAKNIVALSVSIQWIELLLKQWSVIPGNYCTANEKNAIDLGQLLL